MFLFYGFISLECFLWDVRQDTLRNVICEYRITLWDFTLHAFNYFLKLHHILFILTDV